MGFGPTSLSGVRRGFMPPQLKTKKQNIFQKESLLRSAQKPDIFLFIVCSV
jgi:hypothetical protein